MLVETEKKYYSYKLHSTFAIIMVSQYFCNSNCFPHLFFPPMVVSSLLPIHVAQFFADNARGRVSAWPSRKDRCSGSLWLLEFQLLEPFKELCQLPGLQTSPRQDSFQGKASMVKRKWIPAPGTTQASWGKDKSHCHSGRVCLSLGLVSPGSGGWNSRMALWGNWRQ